MIEQVTAQFIFDFAGSYYHRLTHIKPENTLDDGNPDNGAGIDHEFMGCYSLLKRVYSLTQNPGSCHRENGRQYDSKHTPKPGTIMPEDVRFDYFRMISCHLMPG
jgi:hypothetical protein